LKINEAIEDILSNEVFGDSLDSLLFEMVGSEDYEIDFEPMNLENLLAILLEF